VGASMISTLILSALSALASYFFWPAILVAGAVLAPLSAIVLQNQGFGALSGISVIIACLTINQVAYFTARGRTIITAIIAPCRTTGAGGRTAFKVRSGRVDVICDGAGGKRRVTLRCRAVRAIQHCTGAIGAAALSSASCGWALNLERASWACPCAASAPNKFIRVFLRGKICQTGNNSKFCSQDGEQIL
jgi:hypothetical protein